MFEHPKDHQYHTILSDSEIKQLLEEYGSADSDRKAVICETILEMMEHNIFVLRGGNRTACGAEEPLLQLPHSYGRRKHANRHCKSS